MQPRDFFAWVEKYRPQTLADCILSASVKTSLDGVIAQKGTANLLFTGRAGVGKTTVAKALCADLGADALVINASEENGIDVLRTKIRDYAAAMSLTGDRKFVILDEADYLNAQSTQPALRAFMEEFSHNCGFILTANYPQRIIPAIHSRCSVVDFKIPAAERPTIAKAFYNRAEVILTDEGITYEPKVVMQVVGNYFPDFRRVLNELQRHSSTGVVLESILSQMSDKDIAALFDVIKKKDFSGVRKWVVAHDDVDETAFYRMLYEQVPQRIDASCLTEAIILMADYAYRAGFTADKQLNALAVLLELMKGGEWK